LQRARATLAASDTSAAGAEQLDEADRALLARYVEAFEHYDMQALTSLIQEDATQSMPPYDLWLSGRRDILTWWVGPGIGCRGSSDASRRRTSRPSRLAASRIRASASTATASAVRPPTSHKATSAPLPSKMAVTQPHSDGTSAQST